MSKPYVCPVCSGRGKVRKSFYKPPHPNTTDATDPWVTCRACDGKGVFWQPDVTYPETKPRHIETRSPWGEYPHEPFPETSSHWNTRTWALHYHTM